MKKTFEEMKNDLSWKVSEFKFKTKECLYKAVKWTWENKEAIIVLAPVAIAVAKGTSKTIRGISNNIAIHQEQVWKDTHVYDHSSGNYIQLRRKLTGNEMARVLDIMDQTGKRKAQVLRDLGYTKN